MNKSVRIYGALVGLIVWVAPFAEATNFTDFSVSSGNWGVNTNWSNGTPIGGWDNQARINNGGVVTISGDADTYELNLGSGADGTPEGQVEMTGGTLDVDRFVHVGHLDAGAGIFRQSGGTHTVSFNLYVGSSGGTGLYEQTDGTLNTGSTEIANANTGQGTFRQSGGTHSTGYLWVSRSGGDARYELSGTGLLETGSTDLSDTKSYSGTIDFVQTGGTHDVEEYLRVLVQNGHVNYRLSGGQVTVGTTTFIGTADGPGVDEENLGVFTQTGGTLTTGAMTLFSGGKYNLTVARNTMATINGALNNGGEINLYANTRLAPGTELSPFDAGSWAGSGSINTFGGTWNPDTETFTMAAAIEATENGEGTGGSVSGDLSYRSVTFIAQNAFKEARVGFGEYSAPGFAAEVLDIDDIDGKDVLASWEFTTDTQPGESTWISMSVGQLTQEQLDTVVIWHKASGSSTWEAYTPGEWSYDGNNHISFDVDSFSSYGITTIPEPVAAVVFLAGAGGLIARRRWRRAKQGWKE